MRQVFVVEDNERMRATLCEWLETLPDTQCCGTAASGEEALEALDGSSADVVMIDMSLPNMSGVELVAALRARQPNLNCLICSGHTESSYMRQALEAGARGYLLKGDPNEIETALNEVLAGNLYRSPSLRRRFS